MAAIATRRWQRGYGIAAWVLVEQVLPGVTLFALLLWLSQRFVSQGFAEVRQYALAPAAGKAALVAPARKNWWSCTCDRAGGCRCAAAVGRALARCCAGLLPLPVRELWAA